ncbi:DUF4397 domain-containing protein [Pedobacter polaris]|uniref:DUF4397 domain-containing protein n=1 Tax=Pedobacter polaris TaxID=2571273 RepID=A0A4U1CQL7_9SPHI|nr:DUF4397 domain-containing protein [Pedobacter polaris]TKC10407.1 DUF4397 domain-containing protein [Pedobacter polaris]
MKTKTNRLFTGIALLGALVISISSCKKDDDETLSATVTLVNSADGSAAQDAYFNDSKSSASAIAYGNAATNVSTTTSTKTVAFKNAGTNTTTASANVNFSANSSTSLYLVKQANGNYTINSYANDNATVSGKAKVRFVNVAPLLAGTVNVTTSTGVALANALAFSAASAYQTVDANTALNVNMTGSLEITTIAGSELQAGKIYTIWFDSTTTTKAKYHVVVEK